MADKPGWLQRYRMRRMARQAEGTGPTATTLPASPRDGRRASERVPAPVGLYYLVPPDRFVTLDLHLEVESGQGTRNVPCFLFDVNENGLGFACEEALPVGEKVTIEGTLDRDMAPLIRCGVEVVDQRRFPARRPHPAEFHAERLWVHGGKMQMSDAMILLKATLDCLAMHMDRIETAVTVGNRLVSGRSEFESKNTPTELSFGALPVAGVEIIEAELRRHTGRTAMTMPLGFVSENGDCHAVGLQIGRPDKGIETAHLGRLVDFSADGARIESERRYEVGEVLAVFGISLNSQALLFEDRFTVQNRHAVWPERGKSHMQKKQFTFGATVVDSMEESDSGRHAYGLLIHEEGSNLLYKAIMDSVLLAKLNEGRDSPIRNISEQ